MRVTSSNSTAIGSGAAPLGAAAPQPTQAASPASDAAHVSDPELARLSTLLQQLPLVRPDVVKDASGRIGRGDFATPAAAANTAAALLSD